MELGMEKIDRIEQHLRKLQQDATSNSEINRKILSCLVGDEVNGNNGLVHKVKKSEDKIVFLQDKVHEHDYTIIQLKYVTGVIFAALVGLFLKLIFNV